MDPAGKTVWITGASSGIGRALALEMARAGASLVLMARRKEMLADVAGQCLAAGAASAMAVPVDLTVSEEINQAAAERLLQGSIPDILVLGAGIGQRGTALGTDEKTARELLETNFWGAVGLTRVVVPHMIRRGAGQIVVISSLLAKFGAPNRSVYSAAKHALHGWFESLREELSDSGITVTFILPGWVKTEISENARESDGTKHGVMDRGQVRGLTPEECAARAMTAIRRGVPEQLVGGYECGAVWLKRLWPGLLRFIIRRRGIG